jgi:hypothetical protein
MTTGYAERFSVVVAGCAPHSRPFLSSRISRFLVAAICAVAGSFHGTTRAADVAPTPFAKAATLRSMSAGEVRGKLLDWLAAQRVDDQLRAQVESLWISAGEPAGTALLDLVVASFAVVDQRVAQLMEICARPRGAPTLLPDHAWLTDEATWSFQRANLRLYYGRWLAQQNLFEESLEQLEGLRPEEVVDPATLLFYQAVDHHRLLDRVAGLNALARLRDDVADSPARYAALASLMEADLKALEDESLDHIARRMQDVERRLNLGRAGPKTRAVEDGVIESLDKLIEELEKQQQQQQQQQASSGGSSAPQLPASDSRILGGSGPGETTRRDLGESGGWGSLPPKERRDALQQIGKDFPSHYRDVVEQYFRRLATDKPNHSGD